MDLSSECFQKATNSTDQLHILSQEYKKLNINLDHDASDTKRVESRAIRRVKLASGLHENPEESENFEKENEDLFEDTFREKALEEKCGVFGVISNGDWPTSLDVAHIICLGLVGLQHRGQESAGIVTCKYKSEPFNVSRSEGLVSSAFSEISMMSLKGNLGIGHTRYSTSGGSGCLQLAQPFVVHTKYGTIAVAHNGELVNSSNLRETLLSHGVGLTTGGDSELITQCLSQTPPDEFKHPKFRRRVSIANKNGGEASSQQANESTDQAASASKSHQTQGNNRDNVRQPIWKADLNVDENNITSRLLYLMSLTPISYSLIVMYNECLYATRDSFGNRPLTIAMLVPPPNAGDIGSIPFSVIDNCFVEGWAISSESCPFPSIHAKLKRDVEPGEIIKFERNKMPKTLAIMPRPAKKESPAFCIFEYVYFARPDSILERQTVYSVRKLCGKRLAIESPAVKNEVDKKDFIVAPVPESSIPAALGYSQQSGIPYVEVFCKNRYVGRTFIQPSTRLRRLGVAKKFGPLTENFVGKSIILIDDSIVRGTTIGQLVRLLREAGAKEVHIRIASPPLHHPCYMGINIPTREELIANHLSPEQLALTLGAASLKYLSVEGLRESVQSGIKEKLKSDKSRVLLPEVGNVDLGLTSKFNKNFGSIKIQAPTAINANGSGKENVDSRNSSSSSSGGGKQQQSSSSSSATMTSQQQQQNQKQSNSNNDTTTINASFNGSHDTTQANVEAALDGDAEDIAGSKEEEEREIRTKVGHCDACLTGRYPVELDEEAF